MTIRAWISLWVAVWGLSGCAIYQPVTSGVLSDSRQGFRAELQEEDWVKNPVADAYMISQDGFSINYILVIKDKLDRELSTNKQRFIMGMPVWELAEIQLDILESDMRVTDFQLNANELVNIGGLPGYCLNYEYTNYRGVGISGIRCGVPKNKWIYHIVYEGLTEHYFAKNREVFRHFLQTFEAL